MVAYVALSRELYQGVVLCPQLYQGNCFEVIKSIPDNSIDLIVTDPPYEIDSGGGGIKRKYFDEIKPMSSGITNNILDECVRVLKKINIYLWCNKNQLRQYLDYFGDLGAACDLLTWHKTNPVPTCNNKYLSDTEYLLFFRESGVPLYGSYHTKKKYYITPTNKADKKLYNHPTIKPLDITQNLIINSSKEGDTVLDPFMGSGTTGEACINTSRNFIGIELDNKYYETAKQRINNAVFCLL